MASSNTELDRISDLPGDVLDQVLSRLMIKDAVKTSVLSSKWRYNYATLPSLVFKDWWLFKNNDNEIEKANKLASLIDRVLLLHFGPIQEFGLSFELELPIVEIEKWILYLSRRRDLKVFALSNCCYSATEFRVPSSMFSFQSLTDLTLRYCTLQSPKTFKGFKNLKSLHLHYVNVSEADLERLISSSPVLETLNLSLCIFIQKLSVKAPNLKLLTIEGYFIDLNLKKSPSLAVLCILIDDGWRDGIYLKNILADIPRIRTLNILRCMTIGNKERNFPFSLVN